MSSNREKIKCCSFFTTLIRMSKKQPAGQGKFMRDQIQSLIDGSTSVEAFFARLGKEKYGHQPQAVSFLKRSLPAFRLSLIAKEMTLDGIRPPLVLQLPSLQAQTFQKENRAPLSSKNESQKVQGNSSVASSLTRNEVILGENEKEVSPVIEQHSQVSDSRDDVSENEEFYTTDDDGSYPGEGCEEKMTKSEEQGDNNTEASGYKEESIIKGSLLRGQLKRRRSTSENIFSQTNAKVQHEHVKYLKSIGKSLNEIKVTLKELVHLKKMKYGMT